MKLSYINPFMKAKKEQVFQNLGKQLTKILVLKILNYEKC